MFKNHTNTRTHAHTHSLTHTHIRTRKYIDTRARANTQTRKYTLQLTHHIKHVLRCCETMNNVGHTSVETTLKQTFMSVSNYPIISCYLTVFRWLLDKVSCWKLQSLPKCIFLKQMCVCAVCSILFIMFLFLSKSTWNNVPQSDVLSSTPLPILITLIWDTVQSVNCKIFVCFMSNFFLFAIFGTLPSHYTVVFVLNFYLIPEDNLGLRLTGCFSL